MSSIVSSEEFVLFLHVVGLTGVNVLCYFYFFKVFRDTCPLFLILVTFFFFKKIILGTVLFISQLSRLFFTSLFLLSFLLI